MASSCHATVAIFNFHSHSEEPRICNNSVRGSNIMECFGERLLQLAIILTIRIVHRGHHQINRENDFEIEFARSFPLQTKLISRSPKLTESGIGANRTMKCQNGSAQPTGFFVREIFRFNQSLDQSLLRRRDCDRGHFRILWCVVCLHYCLNR